MSNSKNKEQTNNSENKEQIANIPNTMNPLKIIILGEQNVGKSSFATRFIHDTFTDKTLPSIGMELDDFVLKQDKGEEIKVRFWQSGGLRSKQIAQRFIPGSDGIFIFFDVMDEDSFNLVPYWIEKVKNLDKFNGAIMLIGNKIDLCDDKLNKRKVSAEEAIILAKQYHILYGEMSLKQNKNLNECVNLLIKGYDSIICRNYIDFKKQQELEI